jgi:hypothetical protein
MTPLCAVARHNPLLPRPQQVNYGLGELHLEGLNIRRAEAPSPENLFRSAATRFRTFKSFQSSDSALRGQAVWESNCVGVDRVGQCAAYAW